VAGENKCSEKDCPWPTVNRTRGKVSQPGRWGERPVVKDLRHIIPFKLQIKQYESTSIHCSAIPKQYLLRYPKFACLTYRQQEYYGGDDCRS
jgi:hypothetical protein